MKPTITILVFLLTIGFGAFLHTHAGAPMDQMSETDLKAVPSTEAFQALDGKLLKVDGEYYIIQDFTGKEKRLHVSKETMLLNGPKQPGDLVRVEVTKSGHAISIQ